MFENIPPTVFGDPDFKEDSVRELIIAPLLAKLGFGPVGTTRVARSKSLQNPFIRAGTRNHPVTTIPDYTLYVNDKPKFVLDAKGPNEDLLRFDHIQQAYSYAIHPEVRCEAFGLCNGRELVIFDVVSSIPQLHLKFSEFEEKWDEIEKHLAPRYLLEPVLRRFAPDFGTAIKRLGTQQGAELIFLETRLNMFARINETLMTASANTSVGSVDHCISFDFHPRLLPAIVAGLPSSLAAQFFHALNVAPFQASAGLALELGIRAKLGEETQGQSEVFIPLVIEEILASKFNPEEIADDKNDIPPYVFKLRDAFKVVRQQ